MRHAGLLVALLLLLPLAVGAGTAAAQDGPPPGLHLRSDGQLALAWLYGGTTAEYADQITRMPGLSVISPTWWLLDSDELGVVNDRADPALVRFAHDRGIAVWPLLGNRIDPDLTDAVLRDPAARARLVGEVVAAVQRSGVDGVNVDFENLHDRTAPLLTQLVAELDAALPHHVLSVDVTAMTDTWVLGNWSTAFDREGLGRVADYVMLMAYDQHNRLRRDGPVAGLTWVRESVEFLLRTVPPGKVVLGLPFYSRDWVDDPAADQGVGLDATLGMAAMGRRLLAAGTQAEYDPLAGMDLHRYTDGAGRTHRVWHEDTASLGRKVTLVAEHQLAGTAAWRAGFEDPPAWDVIDAGLLAAGPPGSRTALGAAGLAPDPLAPAVPPTTAEVPATRPAAPVPLAPAVPATTAEVPATRPAAPVPLAPALPAVEPAPDEADARSGLPQPASATPPAPLAEGRPTALLALATASTAAVAVGLALHARGVRR